MPKVPKHKHTFERVSEQVSGPDRRGRVTVVTTSKCTFPGCGKTRAKKQKHNYFLIRNI